MVAMRVLVYESNLMWSVRLSRALQALGHEAKVLTSSEAQADADVAIVNLAETGYDVGGLVVALGLLGVPTLGHAGHKEKNLHELGRKAGCTALATNGEIAHHLAAMLERALVARVAPAQ
ncbi:MAG: hypothetical protein HY248_02010 [Fimbriimonas ginsengisoli]|uniref:Uncharacterized protein n=1 Tax=Fimbriimonas ginsengisoli TaxID=1005039 RepID=A0A931LV48_FIMGI|nr:hypothetical protein [Fimbriimonas ginsengisoli]MBI3721302.1 hypothetical protein [Fimbriimonas ginsengisoli]